MKDTQILSAFHEISPEPAQALAASRPLAAAPRVLDACQLGVVLRAVLGVELALGVATMFSSSFFLDWLTQTALLTAAALPATLLWLLLTCLSSRLLARWPLALQVSAALLLGALAGLYGCGVLSITGLISAPAWLASACSGVLLAAVLVMGLVLRDRSRMPADTAARLAELQSRIRPHFLFNTLNSAIALVRAEPARAEALLEDLSDLFRQALQERNGSVSLGEEIALARRYLDIEAVRFGERLQVQWSLDPLANAARLPPLILQPLVENAVCHGVEPSESGAQLRISTQRRGRVVVIKVTNTVPAGPGRPGAGLALRNVAERLALLHDVQGQFRHGLREGVYQVRMEVPL
jgi:two-component system, LytTR family, sensor histidine kinase AlgZ